MKDERRLSASVVMCTHGGRSSLLERSLRSIAAAHWPASFEELIVVENGPRLGAETICQCWSTRLPLRYVNEPKRGASHARNRGIAEASSEVLLLLDDDIRLAPGALLAYEEAFRIGGDRYFYGGPVIPDYTGDPPPDWLLPYLPFSAAGLYLPNAGEVNRALFLGANHALPRRLHEAAGGYDPLCMTRSDSGPIGEETRIQQRLLEQGVKGYSVIEAVVFHFVPPERCTPRWALQRIRRHGFTVGALEAEPGHFPLPPWMAWMLLKQTLRVIMARLSREALEDRFASERTLNYLAGVAMGRMSRNGR